MFEKTLVQLDIENIKTQREVLGVAEIISKYDNSEVTLLAVIPDVDFQLISDLLPKDLHEKAIKAAMNVLKDVVLELSERNIAVKCRVEHGNIYKTIVKVADSENIDLIFLASHTPTVRDCLLGPNGSKVVKHAACSVIVIRP